MKRTVYVGQYAGGEICGINTLSVDDITGAMERVNFIGGLPNTLWLTCSSDASRLYSARAGGITVFDVRGADVVATAEYDVGTVSEPCHMSISKDGRRLYFAEYSDSVCGIADLASGKISTAGLVGSGPNLPRQEKSHAHCVVETPDGRHLCVVDLGSDVIWLYDPVTLELHGKVRTEPGAGPRHLVFHPNGKIACLVYELGNVVTSFRYEDGKFSPVETLPLLPVDFSGHSQAAALKFSEDGTRIFATNRGHDSVASFDIDSDSGSMKLVSCSPLGGSWPRDFSFLPGERIAVACLERAGEVRSFSYDEATGSFKALPHVFRTHRPVVAAISSIGE